MYLLKKKHWKKTFSPVNDLAGAEATFEKAASCEHVGIDLLMDDEAVYGLGIALSEEEIYYIPVRGTDSPVNTFAAKSGSLSERVHTLRHGCQSSF